MFFAAVSNSSKEDVAVELQADVWYVLPSQRYPAVLPSHLNTSTLLELRVSAELVWRDKVTDDKGKLSRFSLTYDRN